MAQGVHGGFKFKVGDDGVCERERGARMGAYGGLFGVEIWG